MGSPARYHLLERDAQTTACRRGVQRVGRDVFEINDRDSGLPMLTTTDRRGVTCQHCQAALADG